MSEESSAQNATESKPGKELIIVAEDSPPNRMILTHLLNKMGFDVIECSDGKVAWETIQQCLQDKRKISAILSDVMMPELDGMELLRRSKANPELKSVPFILVTAVADKDNIVEAKSLQVEGYILKPVTFPRVSAKLQEIFPQHKFPKVA
jgi:two-component system chemotaxis response regulator CheY